MITQDQQILYSLAKTMADTREEVDAIRLVLMSAIAVIDRNPGLSEDFADTLARVAAGEQEYALFTPMTDEQIAKRAEWIQRLVPPHLRPRLQR